MKRVLFDSDVVLDVLLQRQPFFAASALALDTVPQEKVEGYLAAHAVTNMFYLLRRHLGSEKSREALNTLMSKMRVAAVTDAVIRSALTSSFADFEDAVTHAAAISEGIEAIATRNIKDFRMGTIPAMLPEVFLATINH
ncbi:PIN domain-containing protein [Iningainema tapete]|uniref:PIN domain-containing protein n=1 Tax=Iningainema tapete BLCC-T55 TaxID=2748662 RepID=A0A8J6XP70_9CYAN|nr:PIN domain-containing protein [Iningainema tapete BLCC-T55]